MEVLIVIFVTTLSFLVGMLRQSWRESKYWQARCLYCEASAQPSGLLLLYDSVIDNPCCGMVSGDGRHLMVCERHEI